VRINFSQKTKSIVAGRSGYLCSYPGCPTPLTIGPAREDDGVSKTGEVAHIYSAAKEGPRGQGNLTKAQLKSVENAIWLCAYHATLVDTNRGTYYPPAVLVSYKGLHEASIARKHRGIYAPLGWLHELRITGGSLFKTPAKIRFGQVSFLAGGNESGRSSLCEWLTAISDPTWGLRRWRNRYGDDQPLCFEVTLFNPAKITVGVQVLESAKIRFHLNGQEVPFNPISTRFFTITEVNKGRVADHEKEAWNTWSDLQRISSAIHIDATALENILPDVGNVERSVQKIWIEEPQQVSSEMSDGDISRSQLMVKLKHQGFSLHFSQLSSSEQALVLIEIGIALASFSANYVPTVLVLDGFSVFDDRRRAEWVDYFSSANHLFQTIIEVVSEGGKLDLHLRPSWQAVSLVGSHRFVEIHQFGETE
jgi:hypothetical protein